ncbi:unnamed protein product [Bursaphelenchus okinawaensis]|uniref:CCAAT-binding factor domain-containing protein n=1 Tax=Bursaphelenchus okinawaensis TaxID=465554 RepID=A0A811L8B3_9BILA|nr:unnamed protein product [Bursaphelenchus okinawaensis]CAG9117696.1 unnamed protein product [Bursaphelenchus okinawaensis]
MGKHKRFNENGKAVKTFKQLDTSYGGERKKKEQTDSEGFSRKVLVKLDVDERWFDHGFNETLEKPMDHMSEVYLNQVKRAEKLLNKEIETHAKTNKRALTSEDMFLDKIVEQGTMSDKLSAIQLKIIQDPVHSIKHLETLVNFFTKKQTRSLVAVMKSFREIFIKNLLPADRKLVPLDRRPLDLLDELSGGNVDSANKRLILWQFESQLKKLYASVVHGVQNLTSNQIEGVAEKAVVIIADLLTERPEQEDVLLNSLVEKIGHPKKKVAVTATEQIKHLVEKHPNMRQVVIGQLERLVFRKNIPERTQFYAIHTLTIIPLRDGDSEVAVKLLKIYFSMFRILILKKAVNHKMLTNVIRGANRSFPFAKDQAAELTEQFDDLYKVVHTAKKLSTALSALRLLFQAMSFNAGLSDRFYSAFYQRMLTVRSSKADVQFFDLIHKVLKADPVEDRVRAFIKRLLQLALINTPAFAAAVLLLYNSLLNDRPQLIQLVKHSDRSIPKAESGLALKKEADAESDEEEEQYFDVPLEDKKSKSTPKVNGFGDGPKVNGKIQNGVGKVNGILKKGQKVPGIFNKNKINGLGEGRKAKMNEIEVDNEEIEEENKEIEEDDKEVKEEEKPDLPKKPKKGWVYRDLVSKDVQKRMAHIDYDPFARNPLFAHADKTVDTELYALSQHYHPSVAVFAQRIMDGLKVQYKGNALIDFTLIRFLDRFAFKNPKIKTAEDGKYRGYVPSGIKRMNIASKEYANMQEREIPQDEKFLHRFATIKLNRKTLKPEKKDDESEDEFDDVASVNSEEFEGILERFEPGEKNDIFDIDFGQAFGRELTDKEAKARRKQQRKNRDALDEIQDSDDDSEAGDGVEAGSDDDFDEDASDVDGEDDLELDREEDSGKKKSSHGKKSADSEDEDASEADFDYSDDEDSEADGSVDGDEDSESDDDQEFKKKNLKKMKKRGFNEDSDDDERDDAMAKAFNVGDSLSYLQDAEQAVDAMEDFQERAEAKERKFNRKRKIFEKKPAKKGFKPKRRKF